MRIETCNNTTTCFLVFLLLLAFVLFSGEPDLVDVLIQRIMPVKQQTVEVTEKGERR